MAQTKAKCLTFNELALNDYLARWLMMKLSAVVDLRLIVAHSLTLEVEPVGDSYRNRRPDLVVLRPEHLQLKSILKQTALPLGSPAPQLIAEIVSPGDTASDNYRRDYEWKRQQYQTWNVPEYWIIDPVRSKLTVLVLVDGWYQKTVYTGQQLVVSTVFSELLH